MEKTCKLNEVSIACNKAITLVNRLALSQDEIALNAKSYTVKLARLFNESNIAKEVLKNRTTIGVFGASQAGKSYLVSNIAASSGRMYTVWDNQEVDFLSYVNPPGGDKEATGVVTRFTHREDSGALGFPVEIKVMTKVEIAMILYNSFAHDIQSDGELLSMLNQNFYNLEALEERVELCKKYIVSDKGNRTLSYCELVKFADYIKNDPVGNLSSFDLTSEFWTKIFEIAPLLSVKGLSELFSIFWGDLKVLTSIFVNIANEIDKFKGATTVYAKTDVYMLPSSEKAGEYVQSPDNINSVTVLDKIFKNDLREVKVALDKEAKSVVLVKVPLLAASTLEVLFPLQGKTPLENFDVLDFPGARSRQPYTYKDFKVSESELTDSFVPDYFQEHGGQLLRRGKVAYLFERYNARHEIDVMLFCLNSSAQSEVSSLTPIIGSWINLNIGKTPQERALFGKNPLVGVLTRFDEAFTKSLNVQANIENNSGVIGTAIERIQGCEWLNNWENGQPLSQFFFVRRPNLPGSKNIFKLENGIEQSILEEVAPKIKNFCDNVEKEPRFKDLVYGGENFGRKTLDAVFTPNDGGALYINKFLKENYQDFYDIKSHFLKKLSENLADIYASLSRYASFDGAKAQSEALLKAKKIVDGLRQCDRASQIFCDIHELLELSYDDLWNDYTLNHSVFSQSTERFAQDVLNRFKDACKDLASGDGFLKLFAVLKRSWTLNDLQNVESMQNGKTDYSFFYNESKEHFISDEKELKEAFSDLMTSFTEELLKASCALGLKEYLISEFSKNEKKGLPVQTLARTQVRKAKLIISDFNTYFRVGNNVVFKRDEQDKIKRPLFRESFELDDCFPHMTDELMETGNHYRQDYFEILTKLICGENLKTNNPYGLSSDDNQELCEILEKIELYKNLLQ